MFLTLFFFWGPWVDYREILHATLNKKSFIIIIIIIIKLQGQNEKGRVTFFKSELRHIKPTIVSKQNQPAWLKKLKKQSQNRNSWKLIQSDPLNTDTEGAMESVCT